MSTSSYKGGDGESFNRDERKNLGFANKELRRERIHGELCEEQGARSQPALPAVRPCPLSPTSLSLAPLFPMLSSIWEGGPKLCVSLV